MVFIVIRNKQRYLAGYVIVASVAMTLVTLLQYHKNQIFGTTLLLGYDSPAYVWLAKDVIAKGSMNMVQFWNYPNLYVQTLAFFGYLSGNIVVVERILPLLFGALLIYTNTQLVFKVAKNVHIAGLAALLTAISLNVLKLISDFHRNLMTFLLSSIVLMLVADLDDKTFLNRRYLSLILILFIIASTQFETFFILSICLVLYGCLTKNPKKLLMLGLSCAIPTAILILLFPIYFLGYISGIALYTHELTFNEVVQWTGGSWILFGFSILGAIYLFHKTMQRNDKLAPLIFSWFLTIILVVVSIELTHIVPTFFSLRTLLMAPVPILLALSIPACNHLIKRIRSKQEKSSAKHSTPLYVKILLFILALCLIEGSVLTVFQSCDYFLTPHISHSSYEKILATKDFLAKNGLLKPVVVFRGDPPIRFVELYRNYLGMELGEHFAYYGDIENLLLLAQSEPRIKHDVYLSEREKYFITAYYNELLGNHTETPALYPHESYIKDIETLMSHPIIVITPEFYKEEIPGCIKPFHIGEGIYIVPPGALIDTPEVVSPLKCANSRHS